MRRLFLHGFMGSAADWHPFVELEAGDVAVDFGALEWEEELIRLRELAPESAVVVGYSMGARVALTLVMRFPEAFSGLVMMSGHPGLEAGERAARLARDELLARSMLAGDSEGDWQDFLRTWYDQPLFASLNEEQRADQIARKLDRDPEAMAGMLRRFSVGRQLDGWAGLRGLSIPVLAVAGALDLKYASIAERIADCGSHCSAVVVPAAGHLVHVEAPEAFRALLDVGVGGMGRESLDLK